MHANSLAKSDTDMHAGQHTRQTEMSFVEAGLLEMKFRRAVKIHMGKLKGWRLRDSKSGAPAPKVSRRCRIDTRIIVFQNCSLNMNSKYAVGPT